MATAVQISVCQIIKRGYVLILLIDNETKLKLKSSQLWLALKKISDENHKIAPSFCLPIRFLIKSTKARNGIQYRNAPTGIQYFPS